MAKDIYRIFTRSKVSAMRLLLYPLFGLLITGFLFSPAGILNLLIVAGGILFASLLNDYYDYQRLGEENAISSLLLAGKLSPAMARFMIWIPWISALIFFPFLVRLGASPLSLSILWVCFILSLLYSAPPLRLKERKWLGIFTPPVGIYLLYVQALVLTGMPGPISLGVSAMLWFFTWHLEFLHLADDASCSREIVKISTAQASRLARVNTLAALLIALVLSWQLSPVFLVSVVIWPWRYLAYRGMTSTRIRQERQSLGSPIYRPDEFAVYAVIFWVGNG